jgi:hypothetical protein
MIDELDTNSHIPVSRLTPQEAGLKPIITWEDVLQDTLKSCGFQSLRFTFDFQMVLFKLTEGHYHPLLSLVVLTKLWDERFKLPYNPFKYFLRYHEGMTPYLKGVDKTYQELVDWAFELPDENGLIEKCNGGCL